jgi:hypothetical protein
MLPPPQQFRLAAVANRHRTNWTQENALLEEVIADIKYCYPDKFHTIHTLPDRKFAGMPPGVKRERR